MFKKKGSSVPDQTVADGKAKGRLPQSFTEAAADFERSKVDELRSSRSLAWAVTYMSLAITAIAVLGFVVALLTRPEPVPTIIEVDKSTGISNVLRSVKDTTDKYDDVVNKYWLANYVRSYEGYDWFTISEQFETVKLMSESNVATEYAAKIQAPNAPLTLFKDKAKVIAKVTAITFVGDLAQVRFTTEKLTTSGENPDGSPVHRWIATVGFKYSNGFSTDQQRLVNPLGFKVITYRVDPEAIK